MSTDEYICDDRMYSKSGFIHTLWSLPVEEREEYFRQMKEKMKPEEEDKK